MTAKKTMAVKSPMNKITPETKRIIVEAWDKQLGSIGFPPLDRARETLNEILRKDPSEIEPGTVTRLSAIVTILDNIDNSPEPTPEDLQKALEKLKSFPFEFRAMLDNTFKSIKRNLPHKPGGGRPSSLTLDQKKEACLKVGMLMGQGVRFRDALTRVGRAFGVGWRTIQRAWQEQAKLHKTAD